MNEIAGMRVAIYARHSTEAQDRSVPAQLDRCREVARRHDATVVDEFADQGISGAVMLHRPAIMALIKAAAYGEFDAVLIEDLSRVSRDQADVATIFKRLAYHGVALVSVTEGPINELWVGLKGTMNAIFLKDLSDKVRRGQRAAVHNGGIPGGKLYGYDVVRTAGPAGRRAINPVEAEVVRRIFSETAAGQSIRTIAQGLNADNIPSPRNSQWNASTLIGTAALSRGLLRNPVYRGRIVFGRTKIIRNPVTGRREVHQQPESEWTTVEVPELAIVAPEQWDTVQAMIGAKRPGRTPIERKPRPSAAVVRHITSGRIWCGDCGRRITTAHSGYLVCQTWKTSRACPQRHMFRRPDVIETLAQLLASPRHARIVHTATAAEAEIRQNRATELTRLLLEIDRHAATLVQSAAALERAAAPQAAYRHAVQALAIPAAEIDALRNRITIARDTLALQAPQSPLDAIAAAAHARIAATARTHAGQEAGDDTRARRLLEGVIDRITVAYRGGERKRLTVTASLDGPAVYDLGVQEIRWQGG